MYFEYRGVSFAEQVNAVSSHKGRIYAAMKIKNKTVKMQTDTGASCNVLPCSYLSAGAAIQKTKREPVTYSKSKLSVLGTAIGLVRKPRNNIEYTEEFVVVEDGFAPLLGAEAVQILNLVVVKHQNILNSDRKA